MSKLPLKVQLGIRNHWEKTDGPLQRAFQQVKELVGYEVVVLPEWSILLAELGTFYPDKENLIAVVSAVVETWCRSLVELADDEANKEWTDELLERQRAAQIRLYVESAAAEKSKLSTSWCERRTAFVITLPKSSIRSETEAYPIFRGLLLRCFEPEKKPLTTAAGSGAAATDDWADVEMDQKTGNPTVIESPVVPIIASGHGPGPRKIDILPTVDSLPRPDDLLTRAPYHLIVRDHGSQRLEVHCSHSPSLQLIADYLKKWCRVNHQDTRNPPSVDVILEQSPWGLGVMYDMLVLTTENNRYMKPVSINPCTVLALVEGVLGYERLSVSSGQWTYRRDVEFK